MRIAVYENLPPGGALRTSYEIGRQLLLRGHKLELFRLSTYVDKGNFDLAPLADLVRVIPYRPLLGSLDRQLGQGHLAPRSYTLFGPLKRLHRRLAGEIRGGDYDAVLVHPDAMTNSPYLLRWLSGIPTVYFCQEPPRYASEIAVLESHRRKLAASPGALGVLRTLEDRLVLGRLAREDVRNVSHAGVIAVNSIYSRERVWAAYARTAQVCYLGIDPARFAPVSGGQPRRNEVLSVGGPIAAKNHALVIEALGRLPAGDRPALRVVLPRSDGGRVLEDLARARGVELVIETGLDEVEMISRYGHAIATVCAARLEPFGLTALESMACEAPVVAIREGGFRESVIDGRTGILVDPDADDLAKAIGRLAGDPGLARRLGVAGRQAVVKGWTWAHTAARMEEILAMASGR